MSAYKLDDERTIRAGRRARDWMKSGLLSAEQYERIKPELQVDLRRTNLFLRLTLFVFSMMILQSTIGLVLINLPIWETMPVAVGCAVAAVFFFWLAGYLVDRYRLYRFGVEEAAAVVAIGLMGAGAATGWSAIAGGNDGLLSDDDFLAAGLVAAAAIAVAVFSRFSYLYAALVAIVCAGVLPFLFGDSEAGHRLTSMAVLGLVAAVAWTKRTEFGDEHPGDTYGWIEAAAWLGIYGLTNLMIVTHIDGSSSFYWATYAGIWVVPPLGLWLAIRDRQRPLLQVSVLMLLATLMSNKAYLGATRYSWDPIVFGLVLMGGAIALKRWLASGDNGDRNGFTAARILVSDKSTVAVFGTVASLAHPGTPAGQLSSATDDGVGGGGRSGGAGAGGKF